MTTQYLHDKPVKPDTPMQYITYFLKHSLKFLETNNSNESINHIRKALAIAEGLDCYLEKHSSPEDCILKSLAEKTNNIPWNKLYDESKTKRLLTPVMLTGHYQGLILKMFVTLLKATRVLDIGMFTGYSALAIASALPKDGYVIACEVEPFLIDFAQNIFDESIYKDKIKIKEGSAIDTINELSVEDDKFDLIFIDADKSEYIDYYDLIMKKNILSDDGIICVDNTLMKGFVYVDEEKESWGKLADSINKFNIHVLNDENVEQIILPIRDGITVIRKINHGK